MRFARVAIGCLCLAGGTLWGIPVHAEGPEPPKAVPPPNALVEGIRVRRWEGRLSTGEFAQRASESASEAHVWNPAPGLRTTQAEIENTTDKVILLRRRLRPLHAGHFEGDFEGFLNGEDGRYRYPKMTTAYRGWPRGHWWYLIGDDPNAGRRITSHGYYQHSGRLEESHLDADGATRERKVRFELVPDDPDLLFQRGTWNPNTQPNPFSDLIPGGGALDPARDSQPLRHGDCWEVIADGVTTTGLSGHTEWRVGDRAIYRDDGVRPPYFEREASTPIVRLAPGERTALHCVARLDEWELRLEDGAFQYSFDIVRPSNLNLLATAAYPRFWCNLITSVFVEEHQVDGIRRLRLHDAWTGQVDELDEINRAGFSNWSPVFSHDGRELRFLSDRDGVPNWYGVNLDVMGSAHERPQQVRRLMPSRDIVVWGDSMGFQLVNSPGRPFRMEINAMDEANGMPPRRFHVMGGGSLMEFEFNDAMAYESNWKESGLDTCIHIIHNDAGPPEGSQLAAIGTHMSHIKSAVKRMIFVVYPVSRFIPTNPGWTFDGRYWQVDNPYWAGSYRYDTQTGTAEIVPHPDTPEHQLVQELVRMVTANFPENHVNVTDLSILNASDSLPDPDFPGLTQQQVASGLYTFAYGHSISDRLMRENLDWYRDAGDLGVFLGFLDLDETLESFQARPEHAAARRGDWWKVTGEGFDLRDNRGNLSRINRHSFIVRTDDQDNDQAGWVHAYPDYVHHPPTLQILTARAVRDLFERKGWK